MVKKKEELDGVWRTIGGRRVFIRNGQSLSDAMKESGKFKTTESGNVRREDVVKSKMEIKREELNEEFFDNQKKYGEAQIKNDKREKAKYYSRVTRNVEKTKQLEEDLLSYDNPEAYSGDKSNLEGKHIKNRDYGKEYDEKNKDIKDKLVGIGAKDYEARRSLYVKTKGEYDNLDKYLDDKLGKQENEAGQDMANDRSKAVQDVMNDLSVDKGFTQNVDMTGDVRLYNQNELNRMEEHGIKPMENSYTGGGWEGTKYDSNLSTKEIAKNISDYSKKKYPDVQLSRKTDYNGIDIHVMSSGKDLYINDKNIDAMADDKVFDTIHSSIGGVRNLDDWLDKNNRKNSNGTYTTNDARDYLKEQLKMYKGRKGDNVTGNEWYLNDYGKDVISSLNKEMNSYNYNDSDGMVDYFNTNFYGYVKIGKWDKPYEVKETKTTTKASTTALKNAYEEYKKTHKDTAMSFASFKKWYK